MGRLPRRLSEEVHKGEEGYDRWRKVLALTRIPSDWKGFLRVDGNKDVLLKLLAQKVMLLINTGRTISKP